MTRRLLGAVLAGGRSSRFGSDKALAMLCGRTMLDRAMDALAREVDAVVVTGRAHEGAPSLPDRPGPGLGPLCGLCAALAHALDNGFAAVVSVGCDTPLLPDGLVAALEGEGAAVVADCPVVGYWPAALSPMLDAFVAEGDGLAVRRWADRARARAVRLPAPLLNVNTPADLASAIATGGAGPGWTRLAGPG